jgi:hypothetical protein
VRTVRQLHLYLSVFFAPLLIFFIGTGWYQTVSTQRNKLLAEQDTWVTKLTSVHVDQIYPSETGSGEYSTVLFKGLVIGMSASLLLTIALGLYLAFRSTRKQWTVWAALAIGLAMPVVFLWLGQPKQ